MDFNDIPAGLYLSFKEDQRTFILENVKMRDIQTHFKNRLQKDILDPLFEKLKERRPKHSRRFQLQRSARKLWSIYFLSVTNHTEGIDAAAVTIDKTKINLISDQFYEIMDLICTHPEFSWTLRKDEKIGKSNVVMIDSLRFMGLIIKDSRTDLKQGLSNLIEGSW